MYACTRTWEWLHLVPREHVNEVFIAFLYVYLVHALANLPTTHNTCALRVAITRRFGGIERMRSSRRFTVIAWCRAAKHMG
jgi:hypothetical protein